MSGQLNPIVAYEDDPVGDTVHHPYSAASQGYDAAEAGFPASACPYPEPAPPPTPLHKQDLRRAFWLTGYQTYLDQQQRGDTEQTGPLCTECGSYPQEHYDLCFYCANEVEPEEEDWDYWERLGEEEIDRTWRECGYE